MSGSGQSRRIPDVRLTSADPSVAEDLVRRSELTFVPQAVVPPPRSISQSGRSFSSSDERAAGTDGDGDRQAPKADPQIESSRHGAARGEIEDAGERASEAGAQGCGLVGRHATHQIDGIEDRLCRVARHDGGRRQIGASLQEPETDNYFLIVCST
jgi:hypothetical protein